MSDIINLEELSKEDFEKAQEEIKNHINEVSANCAALINLKISKYGLSVKEVNFVYNEDPYDKK